LNVFNDIIIKQTIVIFCKPFCYECDKIKLKIQQHESEYEEVDITKIEEEYDIDSMDVVNYLKEMSGVSMFPFCFYDGKFVQTTQIEKKLIKINFEENIENI
jgi:glutaredoxin